MSPATWERIRIAAFAGRIALLPAALLALLAALVDRPADGPLLTAGTMVLALTMGTLAGLGLVRPQRALDLGAVLIALLLTGTEAVQAFGFLGRPYQTVHLLPLLAWLTLLAGGGALAAVLLPGPVAESLDDAAALGSRPASGPVPAYAPAPAYASGTGRAPTAASTPARAHAPVPTYAPAPTYVLAPTYVPAPASAPTPTYAPPAAVPSPLTSGLPGVARSGSVATGAPGVTAGGPVPGWYPSPDGTTARYWDGDGWTGTRRPLSDFEGEGSTA